MGLCGQDDVTVIMLLSRIALPPIIARKTSIEFPKVSARNTSAILTVHFQIKCRNFGSPRLIDPIEKAAENVGNVKFNVLVQRNW